MKISKGLVLVLFLIGFSLVLAFQSSAQTQSQTGGEGLTISPPIIELNLDPGEVSDQTIKVTNPTANLTEVYPTVMNFEAKGETGEPRFFASNEETSKFALADWITLSQSKLALTPEQVVEFKYQIIVPQGAEPGGHYGVVFFGTEPPKADQSSSQVAVSSKLGALILVKISGAIKEVGSIKDFSTTNKFFFKPPVDFLARISNSGNVHFKPQGDITITNLRGKKLAELPVNESKGNVLPDSIRKFEVQWTADNPPFYQIPLGRFKADLNLTYGEKQQILTDTLAFWIIPWWLIITVGVVILLIIIIIILSKRKKKQGIITPDSESPKQES